MPSAKVNSATKVNARFFPNMRTPKRMSCKSVSIFLFPIADFRLPIWSLDFGLCRVSPSYREWCKDQRPKTQDRLIHSYLNATNGSTFVALRAGITQAHNETTIKPTETV